MLKQSYLVLFIVVFEVQVVFIIVEHGLFKLCFQLIPHFSAGQSHESNDGPLSHVDHYITVVIVFFFLFLFLDVLGCCRFGLNPTGISVASRSLYFFDRAKLLEHVAFTVTHDTFRPV